VYLGPVQTALALLLLQPFGLPRVGLGQLDLAKALLLLNTTFVLHPGVLEEVAGVLLRRAEELVLVPADPRGLLAGNTEWRMRGRCGGGERRVAGVGCGWSGSGGSGSSPEGMGEGRVEVEVM